MSRNIELPPDGNSPPGGFEYDAADWWHASDDGRLVCDLCPRACSVGEGKRGFCFVRQNLGGRLVSSTYGRSTGFSIDPIEKKPLNQFYPGTAVLSFGTAGCNLGCKFCQNWSTSKSRDVEAASEVADPQSIAAAASRLGCRGVAFTYNDPIVWAEYAIDTARACHVVGIKTVAVTSGYIGAAALAAFFGEMDAANVDLKGFSDDFYRDYTGGRLGPVLDTLRWLIHESDVWVEITNLLIPDANDSTEELRRMCAWIADELGPDVPIHFTAFHPDFQLTDTRPTPPETLRRAYDVARQAGLNYVYTGNLSDPKRQGTYCPGCGGLVIGRDGYRLGVYALQGNRCRNCGRKIAGRFDPEPGTWGPRRQPVRIADYAQPKTPIDRGKAVNDKITETPAAEASESAEREPDRPKLTADQEKQIFAAAGRRVTAAVRATPVEPLDQTLAALGEMSLLGAFVSLKRTGQLRSCCGFLGESLPLGEALEHASVRAAKDDPRFPPISPSELDHLDMEVWLLWGREIVHEKGEDRVGAVIIGKHGLQIARGGARGLLLPGVAVEHNLSPRSFLEHVCRKAGLPPDAWKDDDAKLTRFEGYAIGGRLDPGPVTEGAIAPGGPTPGELARLVDFCHQNLQALVEGAVPNFYLPGGYDGSVSGVALSVEIPGSRQKMEISRVGVREELPLQTALYQLVQAAAGSLRSARVDAGRVASGRTGLTVYWDPAMHGTVAAPQLDGFDPARRAVLVLCGTRWCAAFDPQHSPRELLDEATARVRPSEPDEAAVCSLAIASSESRAVVSNTAGQDAKTAPDPAADVRRPAVAGTFYPGDTAELERTLDSILPTDGRPEPWAAAMVPHAGWIYSGRLAAQVFGRVKFPPQVIIFAPKHRAIGADWAVAPHATWSLPGRDVASDPELARRLACAVDGLELDATAHAQEHAIEVQLPLIARLAPESRVVGVAMHGGGLEAIQKSADQLAALIADLPERPLLVISTDMNHYADDASTRRVDRMALSAIEDCDPKRLYDTVVDNRISMCGIVPAVLVLETLKRLGCLDRCEQVGYATSAEASGDTTRVVGYAGMLFG